MTVSDIVNLLDKKYSGPDKVLCPNQGKSFTFKSSGKSTEDHGHLAVHGSGSYLICGVCGYNQPVGRP